MAAFKKFSHEIHEWTRTERNSCSCLLCYPVVSLLPGRDGIPDGIDVGNMLFVKDAIRKRFDSVVG